MGGQVLEHEAKTILRKGIEQGDNQTSNLYKLLFKDGRITEMEQAFDDKEFRHKLMQEYGLNEKID